jgi:hypothetical protein
MQFNSVAIFLCLNFRPGVGKYRAEDIDSNLCTHVLYGFAVLDGSTLTIKSHDPWADFDDGLGKNLNHNYGIDSNNCDFQLSIPRSQP